MLKISYNTRDLNCSKIMTHILDQKFFNRNYRVIDIGGEATGWTNTFADMIINFKSTNTSKSMCLDICEEDSWQQLIAHVKEKGMYDYAICTHILEDVYNPFLTLKYLPKIAHRGAITTPYIINELSREQENIGYIGNIHHRWIFDVEDNKMLVIPKLTVLEAISNEFDIKIKSRADEILFEWNKEIPYKIFMNNFLGPDVEAVVQSLKKLIEDRI